MIEELLSKEIFSKVQVVVKEIIQEKKCLTVTGREFYDKFYGKFGFFTRLLISSHQDLIVTTFDTKMTTLREIANYIVKWCPDNSDNTVNKLIVHFLKGNAELESSWNTYLESIPKGGRRKPRTRNNKKTQKGKRMKYK
jgi:hypothetical protein